MNPAARDDLLVRELADEAVVYDFATARAHCINPAALQVFRLCDGQKSVKQIARALGAPFDEGTVWIAVGALAKAKLLREPAPVPPVDHSRRRFFRTAAATALVPLVWSIVAPTPAYAASCTVNCVPASACMVVGTCCGASGTAAHSCNGSMCEGNAGLCMGCTCL
jgi:hypothetical protein